MYNKVIHNAATIKRELMHQSRLEKKTQKKYKVNSSDGKMAILYEALHSAQNSSIYLLLFLMKVAYIHFKGYRMGENLFNKPRIHDYG